MDIKAIPNSGGWRTGHLSHKLAPDAITQRLGIPPMTETSDDEKVSIEWAFSVDGVACGIWDYKGFRWSTFGPRAVFEKLFPGYVE